MPAPTPATVEIEHLTKHFGPVTAVDDVSFSVARGEVLGFLGPNGAGKSTTMKMITGFLTPDAGVVRVGGTLLSDDPVAIKRRIGYLPEGAPLYSDMTPLAFLDFIAEIRRIPAAERRSKVERAVEQINLGAVVHQPIETLSKGFKRRVGLAQAILHDPEVLILDEPTDGLDPNQKHEVRTLIESMAQEKVIILSTHILEEVHAVCSRAIIITAGKLVSDSTPRELEARAPRHNAVTLTLSHTDDADEHHASTRDKLAELARVAQVTLLDNDESGEYFSFLVVPESGASIASEVSQLASSEGWRVEGLQVEQGRLDDVFRLVTLPDQSRT